MPRRESIPEMEARVKAEGGWLPNSLRLFSSLPVANPPGAVHREGAAGQRVLVCKLPTLTEPKPKIMFYAGDSRSGLEDASLSVLDFSLTKFG